MDKIKTIIFDLDNTLIFWKDEYISALKETLDEYNLDIDVNLVDNAIDTLDKTFYILKKDEVIKYINDECQINIDINFLNSLFERQKKLAPYDENLIRLMKYLSSKYTLILYTNYFHDVQAARLKEAGILSYFSEIYGGDDVPVKPNKEGFNIIIGNNPIEEYLMIGDSIRCDVNGALNFGIKPILYDYKNMVSDKRDYLVIKNLDELKEML